MNRRGPVHQAPGALLDTVVVVLAIPGTGLATGGLPGYAG